MLEADKILLSDRHIKLLYLSLFLSYFRRELAPWVHVQYSYTVHANVVDTYSSSANSLVKWTSVHVIMAHNFVWGLIISRVNLDETPLIHS